MTTYKKTFTSIGLQKQAEAIYSETDLVIAHIVIGDANGEMYDPSASQTSLVNQRNILDITEILSEGNSYKFFARIPSDTESYTIREIGLTDSENNLLWVSQCNTQTVLNIENVVSENIIGVQIDVTQGTNVVLADENIQTASKNYVNQNFQRISEKGMAEGYCPLNENGIIPEEYLPAQTTLPIGTIITHTCSSTFTPQGCLACDGTEYSKSLFLEFWTNYLSMDLVQTCTEAEYISMFETYGACPKFTIIPAGASVISQRGSFTNLEVNSNTFISNFEEENVYTFTVTSVDNAETIWTCDINSQTYTSEELANLGILLDGSFEVGESFSVRVSTSQRFKVPYIPNGYFIQQAMTNNELGKAFKAGLPDHTHDVFAAYYQRGGHCEEGGGDPDFVLNKTLTTNLASVSNSIYGNSDTVQPKSVALRYFVVIASGVQNESQMNWSEWATSLSGKLNADMSNCTKPFIINKFKGEIFKGEMAWYRVYSDGWVEQGGFVASGAVTNYTITYLVPMADTSYMVSVTPALKTDDTGGDGTDCALPASVTTYGRQTTGLRVSTINNANYGFYWEVKGLSA